jgi:hypothetical protein
MINSDVVMMICGRCGISSRDYFAALCQHFPGWTRIDLERLS